MSSMDTVWARDSVEGFILCNISDIYEDGVDVLPFDRKFPKRKCAFEDIFQAGDHEKDVDDNCK